MKNPIRIHPLTVALFIAIYFTPCKSRFYILYLFVFLHEITHMLTALALKEKVQAVHLLPFGCMLSLGTAPSNGKSALIFLSGPLFNLAMFFLGVFPYENLSLALFNLIPVMPLDGGVLINLAFPSISFFLSCLFVASLTFFCIIFKKSVTLPAALFILLFVSEKNKIEHRINSRIITHFSVEKKAKKLYNTIDKL